MTHSKTCSNPELYLAILKIYAYLFLSYVMMMNHYFALENLMHHLHQEEICFIFHSISATL
ncbi:hypothetical protein D4N19_26865 [Klebsiella pneumoniae]|nr:hypothetical protein C4Y86_002905 [Klebsiella pneumoniae subsp. pneumoniae]TXT75761.1 hypothetical protein D4N19_26865 [Klebsiella pneumoniae]HBY1528906.1 hypothetical protein [Klebsiella pneumoniae]